MDSQNSDLLSKLLSNPESIKALSEVAKGIMGTNQSAPQSPVPQQINEENLQAKEALNISKTTPIPQKNTFDDRANLLYSIKPYLRKERHDKVDSLIKAINIAKLINTYTNQDLNN